jgi:hypothetical protein
LRLDNLFDRVADAFDGPLEIERAARTALRDAAGGAEFDGPTTQLPADIVRVMSEPDAHPACQTILSTPLPWAPPKTSDAPAYVAHSRPKVHVELIGPDGLVNSAQVRLGLYGIQPGAEYGIRTHPAEEIFVMLAGRADWLRGTAAYAEHGPGERSHHPSLLPHATRTRRFGFMSAYVWHGDISTENYVYAGIPDN